MPVTKTDDDYLRVLNPLDGPVFVPLMERVAGVGLSEAKEAPGFRASAQSAME